MFQTVEIYVFFILKVVDWVLFVSELLALNSCRFYICITMFPQDGFMKAQKCFYCCVPTFLT